MHHDILAQGILWKPSVLNAFRMPPLRLEDHATTAEPPAVIAATIRAEATRAIKGRKTARMFAFRNKYRVGLVFLFPPAVPRSPVLRSALLFGNAVEAPAGADAR